MSRLIALMAGTFAVASCWQQPVSTNVGPDYSEVVAAVLAAQPDLVADRERYLTEHPEERGYLEAIVDPRLCVARETAGSDGDFDHESIRRPGFAPDPGTLSEAWESSNRRFRIPKQVKLPSHLRWDGPFSICPNGVLRLGNPEIDGRTARVFVEGKCSGWCGWGGEVLLQKMARGWVVRKISEWWVA